LLGCSVVGTETGAPNEDYHYDKEACHSDAALTTFIENLATGRQRCRKVRRHFAIEPVYKHIVWNPERARTVLDEIHSPNLQVIFDPVNLLHPDNLEHRDEIIAQAMYLLGDEIAVIHLKDYQTDQW
jgi:sugar phosphate isomerase/epimerase